MLRNLKVLGALIGSILGAVLGAAAGGIPALVIEYAVSLITCGIGGLAPHCQGASGQWLVVAVAAIGVFLGAALGAALGVFLGALTERIIQDSSGR